MGTTPTTPTPEPVIAPKPVEPTPLDPPLIYYNLKWRVPPLIVNTQEEADALDPTEWTQNPPVASAKAAADAWPKLYGNVSVPPKVVSSAADAAALGDGWREFHLSEDLVKSAQAELDAAAAQ